MRGFFRYGALAAAALLLTRAAGVNGQTSVGGPPSATGLVCPLPKLVVAGPSSLRAGSTYSLSWNDILGGAAGTVYGVERSADPTFATGVARYSTGDTSYAFPALVLPTPTITTLYHRVSTKDPCTAPVSTAFSQVLAIPVRTDCPAPGTLGTISVSPPSPPSGSTYVVTWFHAGPGIAGAQTTLAGILFRIRRTTAEGVKEWVTDRTSASFVDPPGTYQYEARAEATCGAVGPWTAQIRVQVVPSGPQLVLVSAPRPIVVPWPLSSVPTTRFTVRNAGVGSAASVTASTIAGMLALSPRSFTLAPGQTQDVVVSLIVAASMSESMSVTVRLEAASGVSLAVPVSFLCATPSLKAVLWNVADADVDSAGHPVLAKILNPNYSASPFAAVVGVPWLSIEAPDGTDWNRPLGPREVRDAKIVVDRSKRRSPTGTETGTITLITPGAVESPSVLVVSDDGLAPSVTVSSGGVGAPTGLGGSPAQTRILFPSLANTADGKGIGWFSSDIWVTNSDAASPADIAILMTPVLRPLVAGPGIGVPATPSVQRIDARLLPGETRRFRNPLASAGLFGASSVEVRSTATTISATAIVNNQPRTVAAALPSPANGDPVDQTPVQPAPRYFGAEMRPVAPGEGAKVADPKFVVSGIAYDANRRTNLLLAETSGQDTYVRVRLFQSNGDAATKGAAPVDMILLIAAGQTMQINYPDLFDDAAAYQSPYFYALVEYQPGTGGGAVVPMATVLDNRTQDFSLHVGSSTQRLDPSNPPASQLRTSPGMEFSLSGENSSLPFGGGASPLFFPVGHALGAPLASGSQPRWRTRVTMTNTNLTEQRRVILRFVEKSGNGVRENLVSGPIFLTPKSVAHFEDFIGEMFFVTAGGGSQPPPADETFYGGMRIDVIPGGDGQTTWQDVDVQTEIYTVDPNSTSNPIGEFKTGMEAYPYWHGYSSFQSNLGSLQMEGAESSSRYRTNLILQETGGASADVAIAVYTAGSFVPLAETTISLAPYDYLNRELFRNVLGLDIGELTDVRVVARQVGGDGVFMAFVSKINLATGDPANIFLRPAMAGTGR